MTNKPVRCNFEEKNLEEVLKAFGQRVSVSGSINYRADGEPISIKVEDFEIFPKPETLPGADDVLGILEGVD